MTRKVVFGFILSSMLSACVFIPVTSDKQRFAKNCSMATRMLTLEPKYLGGGNSGKGQSNNNGRRYDHRDHNHMSEDELKVILLASGIVASASAIVSGSIVLMGNTIHWLEYKTNC